MPLLIAFAFLVILFWPEETSTRASPLAIWAGNGGNGYTLASLPVFGKGDALPKSQERAPFDGWDITGSIDPAQAPEVPLDDVCTTLASAAEASELPLPFFARLIWQESRFRQRAVSPVGAQGVAQFMPKVAAELGLDDPFDPIAALPASARHLQNLYRNFGNLGLAAAAYNAGSRRVLDWLAHRGKLPDETRNYVRDITGHPPEKWTVARPIELAADLPRRAPCEGVGGLSRSAGSHRMPVTLTAAVGRIVEQARAEAKRLAQLRAAKAIKTAKALNATKVASATKADSGKVAAAKRAGTAREKLLARNKPGLKAAAKNPVTLASADKAR